MAEILIVDDDPMCRDLLMAGLAGMGHSLKAVADGRAAEAATRAEPTDLVVIDIMMPEQDGLETIQNLRGVSKSMKIIAMTAGGGRFQQLNFLDMAKRLGANATMHKPLVIAQLRDMVASLLTR